MNKLNTRPQVLRGLCNVLDKSQPGVDTAIAGLFNDPQVFIGFFKGLGGHYAGFCSPVMQNI